jgi:hypothetical protein
MIKINDIDKIIDEQRVNLATARTQVNARSTIISTLSLWCAAWAASWLYVWAAPCRAKALSQKNYPATKSVISIPISTQAQQSYQFYSTPTTKTQ